MKNTFNISEYGSVIEEIKLHFNGRSVFVVSNKYKTPVASEFLWCTIEELLGRESVLSSVKGAFLHIGKTLWYFDKETLTKHVLVIEKYQQSCNWSREHDIRHMQKKNVHELREPKD